MYEHVNVKSSISKYTNYIELKYVATRLNYICLNRYQSLLQSGSIYTHNICIRIIKHRVNVLLLYVVILMIRACHAVLHPLATATIEWLSINILQQHLINIHRIGATEYFMHVMAYI